MGKVLKRQKYFVSNCIILSNRFFFFHFETFVAIVVFYGYALSLVCESISVRQWSRETTWRETHIKLRRKRFKFNPKNCTYG